MMNDCLFCKIIQRDIPANIVFETKNIIAFNDINPQAPVHILIIPKKHIPTLNDVNANHKNLLGELFLAAKTLAAENGIADRGYRTVFNCNADAGQNVFHVHLHLLGGRPLQWPPG